MDNNNNEQNNNNINDDNFQENPDTLNNEGIKGNADNVNNTGNADFSGSASNIGNTDTVNNSTDGFTGGADNSTDNGSPNYAGNPGNYGNYNNNVGANGYNGSYYQNYTDQNQWQANGQSYNQGNNQNYGQQDYRQPNNQANGQAGGQYPQYGGNMQNKWNYDDYQKALSDKNKPKSKKRGLKPFIITISSIAAVAVIVLAVYGGMVALGNIGNNKLAGNSGLASGSKSSVSMQLQNQPSTSSVSASSKSTNGELSITQVSSKVTPSVVGIEVYTSTSSVQPDAEGSGIVMTTGGYIVTNYHVIEGEKRIQIVMSNSKKYSKVTVVGYDSKTDIAVLKISATGLTAASFGNSSQLKVGQAVVAIGNPDGLTLQSTVTNGIISGLNRTVTTSSSSSNIKYIQTNAAINPGNSGGPLVNMFGQVVAINTAKVSETGYEGLGFAIPINSVKPIVDSIIDYGYVKGRVKLGISVNELTSSVAEWNNYPSGLIIQSIESDSDAYSKGLRTKDIITMINNVVIASDDSSTIFNTFYKEESKHKAGETVALRVYRPSTRDTFTINVKLEEDKGTTSTTSSDSSSDSSNSNDGGYSYSYGNDSSSTSSDDGSNYWGSFNQ